MLFNSYIFILAFLPLLLLVYFLLGHFNLRKLQQTVLILASLYFYAYFNYSYLYIICVSILFNYAVSKLLLRGIKIGEWELKPLLLVLGIAANLGLLFYFKYFDFFIKNINVVFNTSYPLKNILLPLGISFFTFQQLSYVIDSYRGETRGHSFLDYTLFVSFFPQLVAGPIVLYKEVIPQFQEEKNRRLDFDNLAHGAYIFAIGLAKKVLIADVLGKAVNYGFALSQSLSSLETIIVTFSYTFQLYFDFSGYCDMASGLALMFNIVIPRNFNSPYKALNIIDFWSRWHMTLTRFFTEYLYIPLGGNRKGKMRTYLNIMIVFLLSGLWHGANWTFILWGGLHGAANVLTRAFRSTWEKMNTVFQWLLTFSFVNAGWLLFRADSIGQAVYMLRKMMAMDSLSVSPELIEQYRTAEYNILVYTKPFYFLIQKINGFHMWGILVMCFFICLNMKNCGELEFKTTRGTLLKTMVLTVWSVVSLAGVSTFLYFNF